jgi:hypothetical protein
LIKISRCSFKPAANFPLDHRCRSSVSSSTERPAQKQITCSVIPPRPRCSPSGR